MSEENKELNKPSSEEKTGTDRDSPGVTDRDPGSSKNKSNDSSRSPGTNRSPSSS